MKKWITILLSATLVFLLAACGSTSSENSQAEESMGEQQTEGDPQVTEQYDTVLIGHPIWWGEEPRIMDTFMEGYDLSGKTLVNFCTSGGSGISTATAHLQELSTGVNWVEGHRFQSDATEADIREWLDDVGILN